MKTIKYLFWLIILGLLGTFIYQNLGYFMTTSALKLDLKVASWNWTIPELQNIAYFGICFFLGLILAFIKGFMSRLGLKKEIKSKDATIASLNDQVNTLKTELEVFQHDPYMNTAQEEITAAQPSPELPVEEDLIVKEESVPGKIVNDSKKGDKSDSVD